MGLAMVRIDDRLVHSQVVVGWCPHVQPDHLILCDDEVAANAWESEIYKEAASEYRMSVYSVKDTVARLTGAETQDERVMVVVASPRVVLDLLDAGLSIDCVVVGGMHFQPGRREVASFIFVDDEDLENFRKLHARHVVLEGRDVPSCEPFNLAELLGLESSPER